MQCPAPPTILTFFAACAPRPLPVGPHLADRQAELITHGLVLLIESSVAVSRGDRRIWARTEGGLSWRRWTMSRRGCSGRSGYGTASRRSIFEQSIIGSPELLMQ